MVNMSYCRWENTYRAFEECVDSVVNDGDTLSEREQRYAKYLIMSALNFMLDIGALDEYPDDVKSRIDDWLDEVKECDDED
jgi:hypothetical protein